MQVYTGSLMLVKLRRVLLEVCKDGKGPAKQVWHLGPLHMMLESCVIDRFWVYCCCVLLMVFRVHQLVADSWNVLFTPLSGSRLYCMPALCA